MTYGLAFFGQHLEHLKRIPPPEFGVRVFFVREGDGEGLVGKQF